MGIRIRPATAADWQAIARLLEGHGLPHAGAAAHLDDFLVAEADGRLAGVGGLELYPGAALLRSLAVAVSGTGLGSRLVAALLERARAQGAGRVVLLTTTAATFFTRFGFTAVTRDDVPAGVQTSAEFQGACPAGATVMLATLPYAGRGPGRRAQKL